MTWLNRLQFPHHPYKVIQDIRAVNPEGPVFEHHEMPESIIGLVLPAVEDITQDYQLVRPRIGEIPHLIQRFMKFGIKAVNNGGDVVFH